MQALSSDLHKGAATQRFAARVEAVPKNEGHLNYERFTV